ncbi:SDR family oxidoreductase [Pseudomonas sp. NPDC007930]|uniref:SDR family NAD(P)-dependent oxidoreductase n=1 Tax=Pseudomonas sp. NPDC007930 TaxID=3364417 RepID=UPI0036EE483D
MNPFSVNGKRILVTGGTSGIGRVTANWLSQQGANLILLGRNEARLESAVAALEGDDHHFAIADFSQPAEMGALFKTLKETYGPLDGIIHAAGVQGPKPIRAMSIEHWQEVISSNLSSCFTLIKAFRQKGVCTLGSSVVLMSSVMGRVGQTSLLAYSASKGGVDAMVRSAALELASEQIRVNAIAPGVVATEMTETLFNLVGQQGKENISNQHPLGLGKAEDIAYAVQYLLSPASRWITGTTLVIDGGYTAI